MLLMGPSPIAFVIASHLLYSSCLLFSGRCVLTCASCWLLSIAVDYCWLLLTVVDYCWLLLIIVDCCWLLLIVVACCWLLWTVVDYCWELLLWLLRVVEFCRCVEMLLSMFVCLLFMICWSMRVVYVLICNLELSISEPEQLRKYLITGNTKNATRELWWQIDVTMTWQYMSKTTTNKLSNNPWSVVVLWSLLDLLCMAAFLVLPIGNPQCT